MLLFLHSTFFPFVFLFTGEIFPYLASTLGHDWKMFIYALPDDGAFDAYNCITYAEMNDNSAKNTILNAIEEWAKQCPNSINMEALEAALVKCGRNDIADKIRAKTPSNC